MSASNEKVARCDGKMAEVTSPAGAVRAWLEVGNENQTGATPTRERSDLIDGVTYAPVAGDAIAVLSECLPPPPFRQ